MDLLATLLSSYGRAQVIRLLFDGDGKEYYLREIERRIGVQVRAVQAETAMLAKLGLVRSRRDGNRVYFAADREHPLYPDLVQIVIKTSGWMNELRHELSRDDVRVAFIFGSVARGEEKATSDIDLMVIGDIGLRGLAGLIGPIQRKAGREINPHVYSEAEFRRRAKAKDHFVSSVLGTERMFMVGDENELKKVGRKRSAQSA
jgi:predicted nucleotidyltransferase